MQSLIQLFPVFVFLERNNVIFHSETGTLNFTTKRDCVIKKLYMANIIGSSSGIL